MRGTLRREEQTNKQDQKQFVIGDLLRHSQDGW